MPSDAMLTSYIGESKGFASMSIDESDVQKKSRQD